MLVLNIMETSQFLVFLISFTAVTTYAIPTTVEHIEEWNLWKEVLKVALKCVGVSVRIG